MTSVSSPFFSYSATTKIYTLSLHDALPICSSTTPTARSASAPRWRGACGRADRKSTRLNSSHLGISYAVFCLKKKKQPSGDLHERVLIRHVDYDQCCHSVQLLRRTSQVQLT